MAALLLFVALSLQLVNGETWRPVLKINSNVDTNGQSPGDWYTNGLPTYSILSQEESYINTMTLSKESINFKSRLIDDWKNNNIIVTKVKLQFIINGVEDKFAIFDVSGAATWNTWLSNRYIFYSSWYTLKASSRIDSGLQGIYTKWQRRFFTIWQTDYDCNVDTVYFTVSTQNPGCGEWGEGVNNVPGIFWSPLSTSAQFSVDRTEGDAMIMSITNESVTVPPTSPSSPPTLNPSTPKPTVSPSSPSSPPTLNPSTSKPTGPPTLNPTTSTPTTTIPTTTMPTTSPITAAPTTPQPTIYTIDYGILITIIFEYYNNTNLEQIEEILSNITTTIVNDKIASNNMTDCLVSNDYNINITQQHENKLSIKATLFICNQQTQNTLNAVFTENLDTDFIEEINNYNDTLNVNTNSVDLVIDKISPNWQQQAVVTSSTELTQTDITGVNGATKESNQSIPIIFGVVTFVLIVIIICAMIAVKTYKSDKKKKKDGNETVEMMKTAEETGEIAVSIDENNDTNSTGDDDMEHIGDGNIFKANLTNLDAANNLLIDDVIDDMDNKDKGVTDGGPINGKEKRINYHETKLHADDDIIIDGDDDDDEIIIDSDDDDVIIGDVDAITIGDDNQYTTKQ